MQVRLLPRVPSLCAVEFRRKKRGTKEKNVSCVETPKEAGSTDGNQGKSPYKKRHAFHVTKIHTSGWGSYVIKPQTFLPQLGITERRLAPLAREHTKLLEGEVAFFSSRCTGSSSSNWCRSTNKKRGPDTSHANTITPRRRTAGGSVPGKAVRASRLFRHLGL